MAHLAVMAMRARRLTRANQEHAAEAILLPARQAINVTTLAPAIHRLGFVVIHPR
jgi:hypothetical protein